MPRKDESKYKGFYVNILRIRRNYFKNNNNNNNNNNTETISKYYKANNPYSEPKKLSEYLNWFNREATLQPAAESINYETGQYSPYGHIQNAQYAYPYPDYGQWGSFPTRDSKISNKQTSNYISFEDVIEPDEESNDNDYQNTNENDDVDRSSDEWNPPPELADVVESQQLKLPEQAYEPRLEPSYMNRQFDAQSVYRSAYLPYSQRQKQQQPQYMIQTLNSPQLFKMHDMSPKYSAPVKNSAPRTFIIKNGSKNDLKHIISAVIDAFQD